MNWLHRWVVSGLILLSACTNLSGEPEVISTVPPPTSVPTGVPVVDTGFPVAVPDLGLGAQIYAENCTDCHGIDGAGDGQLVVSGQVQNPGNFLDPAQTDGKTPQDYFEIVTNGKLERLMPPWINALSEAERWAVSLYTYTLSYDADQIALGQEIYARECAGCHGENGLGDGPDMVVSSRSTGNLTDQEKMITLSDDAIYTIIAEGAGRVMPAYGDRLTGAELQAVTRYTRTLSLESDLQRQLAETTPEPEVGEGTAVIRGTVSNDTEGADVPANLPVILHIFDAELNEQTREIVVDDTNSFVFEDVPVSADNIYFISTVYQDRNFASQPVRGQPGSPEVMLPVVIYDVSDDSSSISIIGSATQIRPLSNGLEMLYAARYRNASDELYSTDVTTADGRFISLEIPLPVGAIVAALDTENRFAFDAETFTLYDTRSVLPGDDHFIQVTYFMPYGGDAVIEYPTGYQTDGPVRVLLEDETIRLESNQLAAMGTETIADAEYQVYGGTLSLAPDDLIRYTLSGGGSLPTTDTDETVITSDVLLPLLGVAFGVVVVVAGGLFWLSRRRPDSDNQTLIDGLVSQIAELDAQHDRGEINHDLYQQRRQQLKARLAELMDTDS